MKSSLGKLLIVSLLGNATLFGAPSCTIDSAEISALISHKTPLVAVAIIGGGPTGLAAALPPARSGYQPVVFQGPKPGGELAEAQVVENWPGLEKLSGAAAMEKLEHQAREFGSLIVPLVVDDLDVTSWPYKLTLKQWHPYLRINRYNSHWIDSSDAGYRGRTDVLGQRAFLMWFM